MTIHWTEIFDANQIKWKHLKNSTQTEYEVYTDDKSDHWLGTVTMPENLSWQDMPDGLIINGCRYRLEV